MDTIDIILKLIKDRGISAARLARDINISSGVMTQWKQRLQKPSASNLDKIADYFNVSTDYLLGKTDVKEPKGKLIIPDELKDLQFAFHKGGIEKLTQDEINKLVGFIKVLRNETEDNG